MSEKRMHTHTLTGHPLTCYSNPSSQLLDLGEKDRYECVSIKGRENVHVDVGNLCSKSDARMKNTGEEGGSEKEEIERRGNEWLRLRIR